MTLATTFPCPAVLPVHVAGRRWSIINIGSIVGLAANPDHAVDAASKAGIHGMTRALLWTSGRTTSGARPLHQGGLPRK
ncbi:SDR family NAD(P)-dependent oxidoreductase [Pseudarthrobacter phenanthrenivorans]|uniref:SDR family NAD(P)-dependent oxidoreductase n=1 Tax=Pseudarthrobacter phenanthrenivorans TaxID=361575 RepID=UPI0034E8FC14